MSKTDNINSKWQYPLQWMWESRMARWTYQQKMYRVDLAMEGKPWKNIYKDEMSSLMNKLDEDERQKAKEQKCLDVPEGRSFALRKAVSNRANQMAGGVDTYKYQVNDPYGIIHDDTEELLAAKCSQDYIENRLELLSPTFSRDLTNYGMAAVIVRYDQKRDKNIVERVNPKNCWWDTMYSATGRERFRGFSFMISWATLKKMIEHDKDEINLTLKAPEASSFKDGKFDAMAKIGNKKIRTLNDLDIYIGDLNKLAASPDLQGGIPETWEYMHDLKDCYNLGFYKSFATDQVAKTNSGYNGDDVELTVIYDLERKIEFKIINRRFVISANHSSFCRKVAFKITNAVDDTISYRIDDFILDCPLKFQFEDFEERDKYSYPTSPVMTFLDAHDELCSWQAKRDHVSKILAVLRIETNGGDASSLKKMFNIMGIVLDDIQGDINSIQFNYDYTPIDSQIQYLEKTIMEGLHAYDMFDAMQSMGDRASAAESGMAIGAVAQGLATHQNAIMALYADIARQCIANRVAYSDSMEFPVNNLGNNSSITVQEMALDAIVNVKSKLSQKVQERTLAANALTALGTLRDIITPAGIGALVEKSLYGTVPRSMAATFVKEPQASQQEIANAQMQAQNQARALAQNEQMYMQNPLPYEMENARQQLTPDEMDAVIYGLAQGEDQPEMQPEMAGEGLEGLTWESGSEMANQNAFGEM